MKINTSKASNTNIAKTNTIKIYKDFPSNPQLGDTIYIPYLVNKLYYFNGSSWDEIPNNVSAKTKTKQNNKLQQVNPFTNELEIINI